MNQREITGRCAFTNTPSFDGWGYARRMVFDYDRAALRGGRLTLKEWDFYQAVSGDWVLQLTIGHVSYMGSFSAILFNTKTGAIADVTRLRPLPLRSIPMDSNPEEPHTLAIDCGCWRIRYEVTETKRTLTVKGVDKKSGPVDIELFLPNKRENEKMVIATPFFKPGQFYLNYKENYWNVSGRAKIGALAADFSGKDANALIDWGRGIWPFRQEWFWGNGTAALQGGNFGFNIGWGFGDLSRATENMFFWQGKAYKLDTLNVERGGADYLKPWHFVSADGLFDFVMEPVFDHYSQTKFLFVNNHCHQVWGDFSGTAVLPDGKKIVVEKMRAFCEHAHNQW